MSDQSEHEWPAVSGDFIVGDSNGYVAICTFGKRLDVECSYALLGTCKTENIGIERVIVNTISNPSIRFLILAGPEVPGHLTGQTLKSLHENGIEPDTKRIIGAKGAIPYIENIPIEAVERFREQVMLVDMLNNLNLDEIAKMAETIGNPGRFPESAIWVEFKVKSKRKRPIVSGEGIEILPEFRTTMDPFTSLLSGQITGAIITTHPTSIVIRVKEDQEEGHTITVSEL